MGTQKFSTPSERTEPTNDQINHNQRANIRVYIAWESLINLAWSAIRG
ncbi:hypothetical protein CSC24_3525 [Escherichia coli]|nr:hypothetical protein CSC24_3525 [Escherichia coli]HAH4958472.1 hypothetical protein [Escherichia coli]